MHHCGYCAQTCCAFFTDTPPLNAFEHVKRHVVGLFVGGVGATGFFVGDSVGDCVGTPSNGPR